MKMIITDFYSNTNVLHCPNNNSPEYAFIGRSNVGKSSLINMILNQKIARTSSKPGKTQLINHMVINNSWSLVDLPGYGYAKISKTKKAEILKMTREYFLQRGKPLAAVFFLIDIRIPPQKIDLEWMKWLVKNQIYFIRTFTKSDNLNASKVQQKIKEYNKHMNDNSWGKIPESITTSSKKRIGKDEILQKIIQLNTLFQNM
ncbi:MAG: YihA family ribosome biogenesis GTP-binding protein [Flavobacteriales bacterium]|nr:YihA family ribosome biogenesis GTP-binding protein [Flavobacteriales bacterium]|tara:strand:+ start:2218 stop:2823 length:606 start_codon:yes stop_codon:yes gene_type:complete